MSKETIKLPPFVKEHIMFLIKGLIVLWLFTALAGFYAGYAVGSM